MKNNDKIIQYNKEIIEDIFNKKEKFHIEQASLPIEEKIAMMIELQKIVLTVRPKQNEEDNRMVWCLT